MLEGRKELYPYQFEFEEIDKKTKEWEEKERRRTYKEYCDIYFSEIDRNKYKLGNFAGEKITREELYLLLARDYGLVLCGPVPSNSATKTTWKCEGGHFTKRSYDSIRIAYKGCSVCKGTAHHIKYTLQDCYAVTKKRNVVCLETKPPRNAHEKITWGCLVCGKTWLGSYANVGRQSSGCPHCNAKRMGMKLINDRTASQKQIDIADLINGIVNFPFGKLTLDVAIPEQKIAIEYDCSHRHLGREEKDRARAQRIIDCGWKVVTIKATTKLPTLDQLLDAIESDEPYVEIWLDWPLDNPLKT